MAKQQTTSVEVKATHLDLLKDNNISAGDLPKGTQDLMANFSAITDPASKKAMDEKIYGQIEEFAKKKNEKKTDAKPGTIDVSDAGTAKAAKADEEAAKLAAAGATGAATTSSKRPILKTILGLK